MSLENVSGKNCYTNIQLYQIFEFTFLVYPFQVHPAIAVPHQQPDPYWLRNLSQLRLSTRSRWTIRQRRYIRSSLSGSCGAVTAVWVIFGTSANEN